MCKQAGTHALRIYTCTHLLVSLSMFMVESICRGAATVLAELFFHPTVRKCHQCGVDASGFVLSSFLPASR